MSPYATFIKGIDQYLKEQFDNAIKTWTNLLESDFKCVDQEKLKSLTFYWIGYLHNNRGQFVDGLENFDKAEKLCTDSRKYELQRMKIETRFFNNEDSVLTRSCRRNFARSTAADETSIPINFLPIIFESTTGHQPKSLQEVWYPCEFLLRVCISFLHSV